MSKCVTEQSPAEKLFQLVDQVAAQGGGSRADFRRLTPRGRAFRKVAEETARKIFTQSGDKTYLQIARSMRNGFRGIDALPEAKPVPSFDAKSV